MKLGSALARDGKDLIHQPQQSAHVVAVSRAERELRPEAFGLGEKAVLRATSSAVRGIGACVRPLLGASGEAPSTTARA